MEMSNFAMSCTRRLLAEACLIGAALFIALTAQTSSAHWGIVNLHPNNPIVFDSYLVGVRDGLTASRDAPVDQLLRGSSIGARPVTGYADIVDDDLRTAVGEHQRVFATATQGRGRPQFGSRSASVDRS